MIDESHSNYDNGSLGKEHQSGISGNRDLYLEIFYSNNYYNSNHMFKVLL